MRNLKFYFLILYSSFPMPAFGQVRDQTGDIRQVISHLYACKEISYNYTIKAKYPNSQADQVKGEVYVNNAEKYLYNETDAFTIVYTSHWFYKADHRLKQIAIVNLDGDYNKELKRQLEKDVFENGALMYFIDSLVLKKAMVKKLKRQKDTLSADMSFPAGSLVTNMTFVYDRKAEVFISYSLKLFQPMSYNGNKIDGIAQSVSCNNFKKNSTNNKYKIGNLFTVDKDKVLLKKYNKYKLLAKL
jgi:hypothetical protein